MRVEVDRARCEGHGLCESAYPGLFRLDDDGELEILEAEIPPDRRQRVESAVRLCPVAALRLRED